MNDLPKLNIIGYADRQSVAPGDVVKFMVSEEGKASSYRARLLRMHSTDSHAGGCGLIEEEVAADFSGEYPARHQTIVTGSYIRFPADRQPEAIGSFTVQAYIWPTLPGEGGRQTLIAYWNAAGDAGLRFEIDEKGALALTLAGPGAKPVTITTGKPLLTREWYLASATFDLETGKVRVSQQPLRPYPFINEPVSAEGLVSIAAPWRDGILSMAAHAAHGPDKPYAGFYNGKIDRPRLARRALGAAEIAELAGDRLPADLSADVLGCWDFSLEQGSTKVHDLSFSLRHGEAVNLPARAMTGFNWTGGNNDFNVVPHEYGAIHFHDDDLYDAEWEADFEWTVPQDMPSGCYAVQLDDGDLPGYIMFFVRPPRRIPGQAAGKRPKVVFIAPTAHYLAYANYRLTERDPMSEAYRGRLWQFGPEDVLLEQRSDLGNSLYERHTDGSGVCYSSYLRPVLNMRPNTRLSSLAGDGYVLAFLRHHGIDYDVITDEDLDREGRDLLDPYNVVLTGGHPEYTSLRMWDGLVGFIQRGGRLMYLGGNGFYWRVAFHDTLPGVLEVRRGEDGTRPWVAEPGEYYMSFTGEYGGLWRRNGRAPNTLVGVGFTAQGFDMATYYRRNADAGDPRAKFIFEGVDDEIIGDFGVGFGGAAGQEIDRFDRNLGSPPHALVLATSEGHTDNMLLANEDLDATHLRVGGVENELVRADMVFFETGHGGAVFSSGSISWVAAMPWQNFDNNVAQITLNVLKRFVDDAPFPKIGG